MADLIDRISGLDESRPKLPVHQFMAAERLYALGELTRSEIATAFDLQGDEATEAARVADNIDAQGTVQGKIVYVLRCDGVFMLVEDGNDTLYHNVDGTIDKTRVYEDLQITGA